MREKRKDILEVISYIMWSLSIWQLCNFQLREVDYKDFSYRCVCLLFILSGFLFYKDSYKEVTKEIIKSFVILLVTTLGQFFYENKWDIEKLVIMLVSQIVFQLLAYAFVWIIRRSKEVHGDKTLMLQTIFMGLLFFSLLIIKLNLVASFSLAIIVDSILGFKIFVTEKEKQKINNRSKIQKQNIKKANQFKHIKKKAYNYDKLVKKYNKLAMKERVRIHNHKIKY